MFKPKSQNTALSVGRKNTLGEKDRKALRSQFTTQLSGTAETFSELFPADGPITTFSPKGLSVEIYLYDDVPYLFALSKKKEATLVPSLFALWRFPNLLPAIICQSQAPKYLIRGADLMLPGCIPPKGNFLTTQINAGQLWAVRVSGNPIPFAVGTVIMTRSELECASKGKLLEVLHVLGDLLMKLVPQPAFPEGFTATLCQPLVREEEDEASALSTSTDKYKASSYTDGPQVDKEVDNHELSPEPYSIEKEDNVTEEPRLVASDLRAEVTAGETDSSDGEESSTSHILEVLIEYCLLEVLKKQLPDQALPCDVSAVWGRMTQILPLVMSSRKELVQFMNQRNIPKEDVRESGDWSLSLDLKKTSWKSLKKMANHFKKNKIWQLKELRGTVTIIKVNRVHPCLANHTSLDESLLPVDGVKAVSRYRRGTKAEKKEAETEKVSAAPNTSLQAVTAYQITAASRDIFAQVGALVKGSTSDICFTEKEVKTCLEMYFDAIQKPKYEDDDGESKTFTDDQDEGQIETKLEWCELLCRDQKLQNLCMNKLVRQRVRAGAAPPRLSEEQILQQFLAQGMKIVTLLVDKKVPLDEVLKNPSEHGIIEADAKIIVSTQRTKRFTRTKVSGIHLFPMIDPKQLADRLQKACAASASVCELDELKGKSKPLGVIVQGAVVREVCDVLEKQYGVPRSMLQEGM